MTKKLFGLLASTGAVIALSSCGYDGLTIVTWKTDMADTILRDCADAFEDEYGIEVKIEAITDYDTDIRKRLSTGDYGDVLGFPNINSNDYSNFFEPLGTVEELSSTYRSISTNAVNGVVYGIPSGINVEGVLINKEVWANAGWDIDNPNSSGIQNNKKYPTNHEEFLAVMEGIKEDGSIPHYTNYIASWAPAQWTFNIPAYLDGSLEEAEDYFNIGIVADETPFAPGAPIYKFMELMYDLVADGYSEQDHTTTDWESSKQYLANGDVGTLFLGSWAIGQVQALEAEGEDNIAYIPMPYVQADGSFRAVMGGDRALGVNVNTDDKDTSYGKDGNKTKKELSLELVEFMVSYEPYIEANTQIPTPIALDIPEIYIDFMNEVTLIESTAKPEGMVTSRADIETAAGFMVNSDSYKLDIIDEANKVAQGQSGKAYSSIMNELQSKWTTARNSTLDSGFNDWYITYATNRGYYGNA